MDKETSARVSNIAGRYTNFRPPNLIALVDDQDADAINEFCADVRTLAASGLSQDETPGQVDAPAEQEFISRLKLEHAALSGKLGALTLFIGRDMPGASLLQRDLLTVQHGAMTLYYRVLQMRLVNLQSKDTQMENHRRTVASEQPLGEPRETGGHDEDRDGPVPFDG